ncbi:hypothetical protein GCM10022220_62100 [Actinocatenispora rupis]|uniref:WXG100 family type VII secretion target n=1 Tax=Actinocatenispora rupis TaxID=519421 RepID=A0A8J3JEX9_9ACTN|nr:hypothetical protein Aru02nite_63330 [Actinocatenispora rupis]
MSGYQVTPGALHTASVNCTTTADEVWQQLAALRTYVVALEGQWNGMAQDTFQALMTDYDVYSRMLNDALRDISLGLQGNQVNYVDTEQQNINNLKPIEGDLMPGQGTTLPPSRF